MVRARRWSTATGGCRPGSCCGALASLSRGPARVTAARQAHAAPHFTGALRICSARLMAFVCSLAKFCRLLDKKWWVHHPRVSSCSPKRVIELLFAQVPLLALLEAAADWRRGAAPSTTGKTCTGADLRKRSSACSAGSTLQACQRCSTATGRASACADARASLGAGGAPAGQPRARQPPAARAVRTCWGAGAKSGACDAPAGGDLARDLAAAGLVPRSGWYRVGPGGVLPTELVEAARLALLPRAAAQRFLQRARRCAWAWLCAHAACSHAELWRTLHSVDLCSLSSFF